MISFGALLPGEGATIHVVTKQPFGSADFCKLPLAALHDSVLSDDRLPVVRPTISMLSRPLAEGTLAWMEPTGEPPVGHTDSPPPLPVACPQTNCCSAGCDRGVTASKQDTLKAASRRRRRASTSPISP